MSSEGTSVCCFLKNNHEIPLHCDMKQYDYLIVGSGLFGATFAYLAHKTGKKCLVIDKRLQPGGNVYCERDRKSVV